MFRFFMLSLFTKVCIFLRIPVQVGTKNIKTVLNLFHFAFEFSLKVHIKTIIISLDIITSLY